MNAAAGIRVTGPPNATSACSAASASSAGSNQGSKNRASGAWDRFSERSLCGTISRPNWRDGESLRPCRLGIDFRAAADSRHAMSPNFPAGSAQAWASVSGAETARLHRRPPLPR
jgi:hypothetical protein